MSLDPVVPGSGPGQALSEAKDLLFPAQQKQVLRCAQDDSARLALRLARPPRRQGGYTLLEVIIAFALLALALTLLLGTLSGATRQVRWSADAGRAALHAQSLLDTLGVAAPLQPGQRSGEFADGRYQWSLEIAPWNDPALPPAAAPLSGNRLYEVALTVRWGDGGPGERLELRSLRLVQPGLQGGGVL